LDDQRKNLVQVCGVTVAYRPERGTSIRAVDDASLEIHAGEVLGILGESGCGKSTLANAILGTLPNHARYESGTVGFQGQNLLSLSETDLRRIRGREISLIPQDPALSLNPVMTVGSQLSEVIRAHLPLDAKSRQCRVKELLREVGFEDPDEIEHAYPHQLSGGQRQRIVIAQAVACRPILVIADEPTSKLDAPLEFEIVALLAKIRHLHGTTVLMISHNPALFAGFADRIAVMYAGRVVEVGTTAAVFRRPLHPYTQALVRIAETSVLSERVERGRLTAIQGEPPDLARIRGGCRFEPRCPERMEICANQYPGDFLPEPERHVNCFKYGSHS
jgi:oligopeptide/dipeptide ABC transporter ATP-binding protein